MKKIITTSLTLATLATAANAALVDIGSTVIQIKKASIKTVNATTSKGNISGTDGAFGAITSTIDYQITDLDLAHDGTANDTFNFSLVFTASEGSFVETDQGTTVGIAGNGSNTISAASETITFTTTGASVDFGDSTGSLAGSGITFKGFNEVTLAKLSATEGYVLSGGTSADGTITGTAVTAFDPITSFTLGGLDDEPGTTNTNNRFNLKNVDLKYNIRAGHEAVPEPSSVALLGLGGLALLLRRRK